MTSIMCPTRSRVSHPTQRVSTFQFFGSDTSRVNFSRSRRMTLRTVSLLSAANGLTGAITAVLIQCPLSCWLTTPWSAGRRRGRDDNRRQDLVELIAPHLEPGRQAQCGAEFFRWFVDCESGTVGRDLEQHASGLAVVDRLEVPAVDHRRHVASGGQQGVAPYLLVFGIRRPPGDMVDGADRLLADRTFRRLDHVED